MDKATVRVAAFLTRTQAWKLPCRHMQAGTRLFSTHSAASATTNTTTTPATERDSPLPSSCSKDFETQSLVRSRSSTSESAQQTPVELPEGRTAPPSRQPQYDSEPSQPFAASIYQGRVAANNRAIYSALEPAPFPRGLHLCTQYANAGKPESSTSGAHKDLESFEELDHNTNSTLYRGTLFEYQAQEILKNRLGIYTQRTAGSNDLGVDLRGTWFLPLSASPKPGDMVRHLKVIVQCKSTVPKVGPKFVRELQGSLSYETQPTMAILAISSEFTKQALLPYSKSLWPMALVVIDTETEQCRKLMWNRAAEKVMHGVQVGTQWISNGDGNVENQPVLCFEGKVIERLPGPYLNENNESDDQDKENSSSVLTNQEIPDWDINAEPEHLHIIPEARHVSVKK